MKQPELKITAFFCVLICLWNWPCCIIRTTEAWSFYESGSSANVHICYYVVRTI